MTGSPGSTSRSSSTSTPSRSPRTPPADFRMFLEPQRFIKLYSSGPRIGESGGFEGGTTPKLYYLQTTIDVAGAWDDLLRYINQVLEALRVPATAVRMVQDGASSGFALLVEQAPLLTRAKKRRHAYGVFEERLAKTALRCAGNHYGMPGLVAAADSGRLLLGWSEPTIPVPSPDRATLDQGDLALGLKSRTQIVMERLGCDRDAALARLRQIKEDRDEEDKIDPEATPPPPAGPGGADRPGAQTKEPIEDDPVT